MAEPIIDAHFHVDDVPALGWHMPPELAIEQLDAAGVQTAVIMTITDAPEVNPTALEMIADVCARWPGRFEAYARIHPWYGDEAERLLVRAIRELRFVGLKLHPVTTISHPADESSLRLIRAAARLGAPTMIHCGDDPFCTPLELEQAALRVPEATIVFGHMGAYFHSEDALAVAERCENVDARDLGLPVSGAHRRGRAPRRRRARDLRLRRPGLPARDRAREGAPRGPHAGRPAQGAVREPARADGPGRAVIVDALVYAGASLYGGGRTLDELLADAPGAGVDHLVAAPAKPRDYDLAGASERLAEECGASGGRAVCLARLDPWQDDAADRLAALLEHPAVRGLLLHPWEETFPANSRARRRARRRWPPRAGYPVLVEAGHPLVAEALSLSDLARRVDGTVVMTRGGQVNMAGLAQQSADLALDAAPNLRALSAGMYRQDWLEGCVRQFGAERLLHGSCAPVFDLGYELQRVRQRADGQTTSARRCMGGNAAALFGLATEG